MTLRNKSVHQLRAIAQGYSIPDIFQMDDKQLIQAIELKQQDMIPEPALVIPAPAYDARLMTKPPSRLSDEAQIREILAPHVAAGLRVTFDPERWYLQWDKRTDEGTLRMPLRTVLHCANQIMR